MIFCKILQILLILTNYRIFYDLKFKIFHLKNFFFFFYDPNFFWPEMAEIFQKTFWTIFSIILTVKPLSLEKKTKTIFFKWFFVKFQRFYPFFSYVTFDPKNFGRKPPKFFKIFFDESLALYQVQNPRR